jgi:bifunctional DNase/RNase
MLHKVTDIESYLVGDGNEYFMGSLTCYVENGDALNLYNVPPEVAEAISRIRGDEEDFIGYTSEEFRDTLFGFLTMLAPKLENLRNIIKKVVIDGFNRRHMVYKATLYLEVDGITIKKSMIPSHAIFIALLFDRPIYVTEEVLRISKELDDEEGFFEEEL